MKTLALAFVGFLSVCGLGFILACLYAWFEDRWITRNYAREVEDWRKTRPRAPIVKVGRIEEGMLKEWVFYLAPGRYHVCQEKDPITGERIVWGYSIRELEEIARTPTEFERPELAWFERGENE